MTGAQAVLIALDQLANALTCGWPDETLSSRAWRRGQVSPRWDRVRQAIDTLFFWQHAHCHQAYLAETRRRHWPTTMRDLKP